MIAHPDPPLRDDAVVLRAWTGADVPGLVEGFAGSGGGPSYGVADARAFLAEQERERVAGVGLAVAVVDARDPSRVLGGASLYDVDRAAATASLGYWTAPAQRRRGVATRATRLLAGWGFAGLGLARIALTCAPDNIASQRTAERAGFRREGLMRAHLPIPGGRRDSVLYGLLPGDPPG